MNSFNNKRVDESSSKVGGLTQVQTTIEVVQEKEMITRLEKVEREFTLVFFRKVHLMMADNIMELWSNDELELLRVDDTFKFVEVISTQVVHSAIISNLSVLEMFKLGHFKIKVRLATKK